MALESLVAGVLVLFGALPRTGASVTAGAVFPITNYFDLKQALAHAPAWPFFLAALIVSALVRSAVIASTLWLAEGRNGALAAVWLRAGREAALALVFFFPAAVLFFTGALIRYAPFVWAAALFGLIPAVLFMRRALAIDAGAGSPRGGRLPEFAGFLSYAYLLSALAAAISVLGRVSFVLPAILIALAGPLHALMALGWREHMRAETYPGGGGVAALATVLGLLVLGGATVYDRSIADRPPVGRAEAAGSLLLLGGADSSSKTGALTELDPRDVGFGRDRTDLLSYKAAAEPYVADDTRADLDDVAEVVARQIESAEPPRYLLGHSQAALILDRVIQSGALEPDRSVVISGPPPVPPGIDAAPPGDRDDGAVGGDMARGLGRLLDALGMADYDIDAPAAPANLEPVVVGSERVSRLAIWALADSVWLDGDWRRPGEVNVVAFSDHVGATNNSRALDSARRFLAGDEVEGDETSWRGFLVAGLRYAFEPWRPR
ncbi:MAG: hypothetical protein QOG54_2326 [Actinomycetota bacterium]|jgi:hypothetical protein|nr:hypothetical protein [Actinomycetota bacterium]